MTPIGAGSDTTAVSLRAILYYLMRSPRCYEILQREIDTFYDENQIDSKTPLTWAQAQRMPYFQACVKEALRLHPAVGYVLPRTVPPGGRVVAGEKFAAGTKLGVHGWTVQRDASVFGADADAFRPERFLDASEEQAKAMERSSLVFGAGNRVCIGANISKLEMQKLIPTLLRNFEFEYAGDMKKEWNVVCHWFTLQESLECYIRPRRN